MTYSAAQGIFFDHKLGGRNQISMRVRPNNPQAFEALREPATNPGRYGHFEKIALNKLLYALGYHIHRVLHSVLANSRRAQRYQFTVLQNTELTKALKAQGSPALNDLGRLLSSLRVEVPKTGERRIEVDFTNSPGVIPGKSTGHSGTPAGFVAAQLERGYHITVTPKMRKFWLRYQKERGVTPARALPAGSRIHVRARPFFQPSVDAGYREFESQYLSKGGAAQILFDSLLNRRGMSGIVQKIDATSPAPRVRVGPV